MKMLRNCFFSSLLAITCLTNSDLALAQLSKCAWPIEFSPEGYGNVVAPDDQARYWLMPFETNYNTMKIEGSYPNARYFSFVVYSADGSGRPVSVAGHKYDTIITPDATNSSYTLCVSRTGTQCTNTINLNDVPPNSNLAWVVLRIYVPSPDETLSGQALMGGQSLPKITLLDSNGSQSLEACPLLHDAPMQPDPSTHYYTDQSTNKLDDLRALLRVFFPPSFDIYTPSDYYELAGDRLWFAPPKESPIALLPNPDNKYIGMVPGPYQRGRIIVIHGKAPTLAETYKNSPTPSGAVPSVDVRYWSVCNDDLALPVPAVRCIADQAAIIQEDRYYTIVISDDLLRPTWLPTNVNWLPWGDEQYPKIVFFRDLVPLARNDTNYTADEVSFPYAIQWVVKGCPDNCEHKDAVVNFTLPYVPPRATFTAAGPKVEQIMGDYYPVAVWCDKSTFERGGWQACIKH